MCFDQYHNLAGYNWILPSLNGDICKSCSKLKNCTSNIKENLRSSSWFRAKIEIQFKTKTKNERYKLILIMIFVDYYFPSGWINYKVLAIEKLYKGNSHQNQNTPENNSFKTLITLNLLVLGHLKFGQNGSLYLRDNFRTVDFSKNKFWSVNTNYKICHVLTK